MAHIEAQLGMADSGDVNVVPPESGCPTTETLLSLVEALAASELDDAVRLNLVAQLRELVQDSLHDRTTDTTAAMCQSLIHVL